MKEFFGYTEPFRRFVQNETFSPQANEIPNHAASWLPGDDYYTNFHEGDPFIKVPEGYARLPGAGYEALHPELKGMDPEDYPDIHKMAILADVAPYSREYNQVSPSCRTQKPSRGRDGPQPPHHPAWHFPGLAHPVHGRRAHIVTLPPVHTKSLRARNRGRDPSSDGWFFLASSSSIYVGLD